MTTHLPRQDWGAEPAQGDYSFSEACATTFAWRSLYVGVQESSVCDHARESLHLWTWVGKHTPGCSEYVHTCLMYKSLCLSKSILK